MPRLRKRFVRAPLRARDDRRHRPVRIRATTRLGVARGRPDARRPTADTARRRPRRPAPAARLQRGAPVQTVSGFGTTFLGPARGTSLVTVGHRDRPPRSRPRRHTHRDPADVGSPARYRRCATNARCPRAARPLGRDRRHAAARRAQRASATRSREIVAALQRSRPAPDLVPYTLSLRARAASRRRAARHALRPDPRARPAARRGRRGDAPRIDRWLRPARVVHATNYLAPPSRAADARERLRLLVRPVPRAVHARGARVRADRAPRDRARRDRAHGLGVRRRRDRGDLRARACAAAGRLVVIPLGVPRSATAARMPADVASALGGAPVRARDRHARAAQEPPAPRRRVRRRSRRRIPTSAS